MFNKPEEDGYMDHPSVSSSNSRTAARSTQGNSVLLLLGGSALTANESQQHDKTVAILEAIDAALDAIDNIETLATSIESPTAAAVENADMRKS